MKIFRLLPLLLLLLSAASTIAQPTDAPQPFQPMPGQVQPTGADKQITQDLTDFVNAINGDNAFPMAQQWIYGARVGYFGANEWWQEMGEQRAGTQLKINAITVNKIEGENATATVTYSFTGPNANEWPLDMKEMLTHQRNETLSLKLGTNSGFGKKKVWQIVPFKDPQEFQTGTFDNLWPVITYYLAQKQPIDVDAFKARKSLSNLKELGIGVRQSLMDWDERFAFAPQYLQAAITPYVKDKELFYLPYSKEAYSFNPNLSDHSLAEVKEIARTVMLYEGESEKPTFRYDGKAAICFVDGHVALVTPDEAKDLIWKP